MARLSKVKWYWPYPSGALFVLVHWKPFLFVVLKAFLVVGLVPPLHLRGVNVVATVAEVSQRRSGGIHRSGLKQSSGSPKLAAMFRNAVRRVAAPIAFRGASATVPRATTGKALRQLSCFGMCS